MVYRCIVPRPKNNLEKFNDFIMGLMIESCKNNKTSELDEGEKRLYNYLVEAKKKEKKSELEFKYLDNEDDDQTTGDTIFRLRRKIDKLEEENAELRRKIDGEYMSDDISWQAMFCDNVKLYNKLVIERIKAKEQKRYLEAYQKKYVEEVKKNNQLRKELRK